MLPLAVRLAQLRCAETDSRSPLDLMADLLTTLEQSGLLSYLAGGNAPPVCVRLARPLSCRCGLDRVLANRLRLRWTRDERVSIELGQHYEQTGGHATHWHGFLTPADLHEDRLDLATLNRSGDLGAGFAELVNELVATLDAEMVRGTRHG